MAKPARVPNATPPARPAPRPGRSPVVVDLEFPIEAHGEEVRSLTFRRPTFGDLLATEGLGEIETSGKLIELLAGIPPSSVRALDAADFEKVGLAIAGFFESSPANGGGR
jgi:hypothetical protein